MRALLLCACVAVVSAFPNYIGCASDSATLLKLGTHTCTRALKQKGSDILPAGTHATLAATAASGAAATSIAPGGTLNLTLTVTRLSKLVGEAVWMTARVSDAGATGVLKGDPDIFKASCASQIASLEPIKDEKTSLSYRAPCDASGQILVTVVHSRCTEGCSTGAIASGLVTPGQFYLNEISLDVSGGKDPSCSGAPPQPQPRMDDICQATPCWEGKCADGVDVALKQATITVSHWDSELKNYTVLGDVNAFTVTESRWASLVHGPMIFGGDATAAATGRMPPIYASVDSSNSIFRLDNISFTALSATSKRAAVVVGPSSHHHIMSGDSLHAMVVSSGQPFGDTPGPDGGHMITQGGLYATSPSGCHKLWPNKADEPEREASGGVINKVVCHDPSGVCFFSNWNHEFDENATIPHCLHWCALDDPTDPTSCSAGSPLEGGPANSVRSGQFCAEPAEAKDGSTVFVAPHGLVIASAAQVGGAWQLELISSFSDGLQGMDQGVSFARKLHVTVERKGRTGEGTVVNTTSYDFFGTELTTDTLAGTPYDVRLDHMWRDAAGYVWFSTYGVHNTGEHVLDYETGKLVATFRGFEKYPHSPLSNAYNPSGIAVVGGFGQEGSVAVVAIEAIPPLPTIHSALYLVNISNGWGLTK